MSGNLCLSLSRMYCAPIGCPRRRPTRRSRRTCGRLRSDSPTHPQGTSRAADTRGGGDDAGRANDNPGGGAQKVAQPVAPLAVEGWPSRVVRDGPAPTPPGPSGQCRRNTHRRSAWAGAAGRAAIRRWPTTLLIRYMLRLDRWNADPIIIAFTSKH